MNTAGDESTRTKNPLHESSLTERTAGLGPLQGLVSDCGVRGYSEKLEYESVLTRPEHLAACGSAVLDELALVGKRVELMIRTRPSRQDSDAALNS